MKDHDRQLALTEDQKRIALEAFKKNLLRRGYTESQICELVIENAPAWENCQYYWQLATEAAIKRMNLWSFLRRVLEQGSAIQQDYAAGKYESYEHYSARVDEAAREREDQLIALAKGSDEGDQP